MTTTPTAPTTQTTSGSQADPRKNAKKDGGVNRGGPLTGQEIDEIANAASRVPGLGRIMLGLVRNRNARVLVPETAMGGEMLTIVSELDRVAARGERQLARALTLENLQDKNAFQERALGLITPLAELTAEMAVRFDNPTNSILRHSRTKALLKDLLADKASKGKAQPKTAEAPESPASE